MLFEDHSNTDTNDLWVVFAGLGGGFGGATEMGIWKGSKEDAEREAYQKSIEEYDSYEGSNGLRTMEEIMEEDDLDEDDAQMTYNDERESWLDYYVELYDPEKHETDPSDQRNILN